MPQTLADVVAAGSVAACAELCRIYALHCQSEQLAALIPQQVKAIWPDLMHDLKALDPRVNGPWCKTAINCACWKIAAHVCLESNSAKLSDADAARLRSMATT